MRNMTKPLKSRNRKLSKSEQKKKEALAIKAVKEALGQEITPGTLSVNIKKCPNCSFALKTDSSRDICDNCGDSKHASRDDFSI